MPGQRLARAQACPPTARPRWRSRSRRRGRGNETSEFPDTGAPAGKTDAEFGAAGPRLFTGSRSGKDGRGAGLRVGAGAVRDEIGRLITPDNARDGAIWRRGRLGFWRVQR